MSSPALSATVTLTFGDQAENHVGMQKLGKMAEDGFSLEDIEKTKAKFEDKGYRCEIVRLHEAVDSVAYAAPVYEEIEEAYVLIIRKGLEEFVSADLLLQEQIALDWDSKAFMYGRVVNKKARHNLCYGAENQEPDYKNGKGRIIAYKEIPYTSRVKEGLPNFFGEKAKDLECEGNKYYDVSKCGIGFHGDAERMRVIGCRLGAEIPLHFQWFCESKPVGSKIELMLSHGDMYVMSQKATGNDWKKRKIHTLRHAAGAKAFLMI